MLKIEKWLKDKPPVIGTFAVYVAVGAENAFEGIQATRLKNRHKLFSELPCIDTWLSFYRNLQQVRQSIFDKFREDGEVSKNITDLSSAL